MVNDIKKQEKPLTPEELEDLKKETSKHWQEWLKSGEW